ncbi:MAG: hypothetical protein KGQ59_08990 [Bdellovibrionales bacterium]|nr:hypothetical protein [Bdellovibrionales bacterium]
MSLITYGMLSSSPSVQEIADQYFVNFWTIQGWGSLSFFLLTWGLSMSNPVPWLEMTRSFWISNVLPAFLKATVASAAFICALIFVAPSQYLGPGFSWTDAPWTVFNWLLRSFAWWGWALGDELVFRKLLLSRLIRIGHSSSFSLSLSKYSGWIAVAIVTALWVITRTWNQDLGLSQTLTLVLLGLLLGARVLDGRHYLVGAAFLAAAAWVFQSLFSLPLFGHEFPGIWIVKFSSVVGESLWPRLLSGGAGGPLASALLQLFLLLSVVRILWTTHRESLR